MNRFGMNRATMGAPSKATPTTLCQKCLKRDSYECKAIAQERPYVSRPSRTQQLQNPKLVPKLTSDVPQDLLRKKGVADEQLAKAEMERGRKRARESEDSDQDVPKRRRSVSSASSVSVSTISTNLSRSPSPRPSIPQNARQKSRALRSESPPTRRASRISISPPRRLTDSEKKRRRDSFSSVESRSSEQPHRGAQDSEERYTRRKIQEHSPRARGRSPYRGNGRLSNDRRNSDEGRNFVRPTRKPSPPRERSLSPFSKRLALTQAMNMS